MRDHGGIGARQPSLLGVGRLLILAAALTLILLRPICLLACLGAVAIAVDALFHRTDRLSHKVSKIGITSDFRRHRSVSQPSGTSKDRQISEPNTQIHAIDAHSSPEQID